MKRLAAMAMAMATCMLGGVSLAGHAEEPAVVKIWNWNVHDKKFQQGMYKLFNQRNPGIRIEYSSISNTVYGQTLEAAFVARQPPDIFLPSDKMSFEYLRTRKMIAPLSDIAPTSSELRDWMARFPPVLRKFVEGASVFDGKPFVIDLSGASNSPGFPLFYNKTLFKEAGISKPPAIYSELRQAAAKVTQAGQGKYFGISHGLRYRPGAWQQDVAYSIAKAGGALGTGVTEWGFDPRDGRFHTSSPEFVNALNVWIGMRKDGSIFPGEEGMEDEQAKTAFATNKAAFFFGGWWVPGNVLAYNGEADFDLVLAPTPDDGVRRGFIYTSMEGTANGYVVSSTVKSPKAAWEVIQFLSSLEYQEAYVKGGFGISYLPEANKPENFTVTQMYKFVEWAVDPKLSRVGPVLPEITTRMSEYMPGFYPPWSDVIDSVYFGKAGIEAIVELDRKQNESLDLGIAKAREAGVKVTRQDFIVPDWDPMKDYVPKKK